MQTRGVSAVVEVVRLKVIFQPVFRNRVINDGVGSVYDLVPCTGYSEAELRVLSGHSVVSALSEIGSEKPIQFEGDSSKCHVGAENSGDLMALLAVIEAYNGTVP